jgi:rSAM/selenodomain-associated transferase 1
MAKAPRAGRVKTRLAPPLSPDAAATLAVALLTDTIRLASTLSGIRIVLVCARGDAPLIRQFVPNGVDIVEQLGSGLATALASTFDRFLAAGYQKVIAFNSDSPHIPRETIDEAFAALDTVDLVVGPTEDGGYYLVGAKAAWPDLFNPTQLGTSGAHHALTTRATELMLRVASCAPTFDVDLPADLARLSQELRGAPERAPATAALLAEWLGNP